MAPAGARPWRCWARPLPIRPLVDARPSPSRAFPSFNPSVPGTMAPAGACPPWPRASSSAGGVRCASSPRGRPGVPPLPRHAGAANASLSSTACADDSPTRSRAMRLTDGPAAGPSSLERSSCCLPLSAAAPQALRSWPEPPPRCRLFCCSPKGPTGNGGRHSASGGCLNAPFEAAWRRMLFRCSPGGLAETRLRQGAPNGRQTACHGRGRRNCGAGFAPSPEGHSTAQT